MSSTNVSTGVRNPLFELQQTLYTSSNFTRRRLHQTRLKWIIAAIEGYAPSLPDSSALEYGPGSGVYLPFLAQSCAEVTAADIEDAYLSAIDPLAAGCGSVRLVRDDIQDSSFQDNSFGLVLCSEVLEHVPNPEISLKTIFRILQPGGIAIVTTPQRYSLLELACKVAFLPGVIQAVRWIYKEPVLPSGHISLRTSSEFRAAIVDSGLIVLASERFGLYVPLVAEIGKDWGGRLLHRLERRLKNTALEEILWTQAYVLHKPRA